MNVLSKIPQNAFDKTLSIVLINSKQHIHRDKYNTIVSKSIMITSQQIKIPVIGVHPLLFPEMYDPVETEGSIALLMKEFLLLNGVKSIQPTKATNDLGRYLLI